MSFDSTIHAKAVELTRLTYEITGAAGSGHPSSGASLSHLVAVLLYQQMRWEPQNPSHPSSDRLVLSEGHAVPILYAALADVGAMVGRTRDQWRPLTPEEAKTLREIDSVIDGHPNPVEGVPFFDTATGSLGQGLSQAAGMALAARLDGLDKRIYCIIGDGESREGNIWEAVDFIADNALTAVCPIFNCNAYAQSDAVADQQAAEVTQRKLEAVGFKVLNIDGHQPTQIGEAFSAHAQAQMNPGEPPVAIVARTVKGWGAPSQQGNGHHGSAPTGDELQAVLDELAQTGKDLGAHADQALKIGLMSPKKPEHHEAQPAPGLEEALKAINKEAELTKGKMATRKAYGYAVQALGRANPRVVALDADVQGSTGAGQFAKDDQLKDRFFECRIAEQNMVAAAAGLSAAGKIPYVSTFGKFFCRAYDQIEMAVNSGANIKLVGSHAGISLGADGPSQMALPDLAWFRSFSTMKLHTGGPGFFILQPADAYAAYALIQQMAEHYGPCYMRTHRPDVEFLYGPKDIFALGGHQVLTEGRDLLIVASGYMVHEANKALDALDGQGVDATLVDLYSLPFDGEAILDLANENNGMVLTVADNYGGGIGSAVADVCASSGDGFTITQMHVTHLPKSGKSPDDLLHYCGLSHAHIADTALRMLQLQSA
jgi:transketolase